MRDRIKDLREDNDLKQRQVARIIGITQRKYSYIERGIQEPSKEILLALSELYNTSVDYILGNTYVKEAYPKGFKRQP